MSSQTTNLHLVKPADNEVADIDVINDNMDTIDTAVQSLRESVSLHTVQVQNVSCGAGAEVKIATLPSGSLFIGIDASTGSSGKLVIRQYQTTSVYAYNTTNSSITLSGTVYYLTI